MPGNIPADTPLTDRDLILHLLEHVEAIHDELAGLLLELEPYRPLLARLFPAGRPADMVSLMQTGREARRGRRRA